MTRKQAAPGAVRLDLARYLEETRSVAVSLVYVAPLAIAYEVVLARLDPGARGRFESRVHDLLWYLGDAAHACHAFLALVALGALIHVRRRGTPVFRMLPAFLAETMGLAVLLGPLAMLIASLGESAIAAPPPPPPDVEIAVLASIGAGIYEEFLFRLIVLGGTLALLENAFRVQRARALTAAIVVSALAFSLFHHLGPFGEPVDVRALGFRFVAGIILGVLFAARGLGVAVYLHTFYDLLYDLRGVVFTG